MQDTTLSPSCSLSRFFQFSFNVFLARFMYPGVFRYYIFFLGFIYYTLLPRERVKIKNAQRFIIEAQHPRVFLGKVTRTLLKTYIGIFEHYHEKLINAYRGLPSLKRYLRRRLNVHDNGVLREIALSGKGAILVTGHYGAVEFFPLIMHMQGAEVAMICNFKTKRLREQLLDRAASLNVTLIDATEPNVAFRALAEIGKGKILITECDEFKAWRPYPNKWVRVFGYPIPLDRTLDFLYRRSRVPVYLGLLKRNRGRLDLEIEEIADGHRKVSVSETAWEMLEKAILQAPEQWYQWKDANALLTPFMEGTRSRENQEHPFAQAPHPVSYPNIA